MTGSLHEQKKNRIAGFESVKAQLYPLAETHQWLKKRAKRRNEKEEAECYEGSQSVERLGKTQVYPLAMCFSTSQCAAACYNELLCVVVCGGALQLGASVAGSRAGGKHSVLKHVADHCKVLRQWMLLPKKKNKDTKVVLACSKVVWTVTEWCQMFRCVIVRLGWWNLVQARCSVLCVGTGQTMLLCAAVCCYVLRWVASKFRHINIHDNRYVNRNKCVYKGKCIWDIRKCMKSKVNHLYEQIKDISTGAVAYGLKGNPIIDRATFLCSGCTIFYGQVQKSRDSGFVECTGDGK